MLRSSLSTEVAELTRTFEISNNASLGLPNGELIEYVRRMETNIENSKESVNKVFINPTNEKVVYGNSGKRNSYGNSSYSEKRIANDEFNRRRRDLLGNNCSRCGKTARTNSHPE